MVLLLVLQAAGGGGGMVEQSGSSLQKISTYLLWILSFQDLLVFFDRLG
jgi:hypothetical protein